MASNTRTGQLRPGRWGRRWPRTPTSTAVPDGSRYADILQPHHPTPDGSPPGGGEPGDDPVLRGEGFLPGETVLVAVVTTTIAADQNGAATLTDSPSLPHQLGDVVLFGSASG